ncbi:hypothetical protein AKJ08_0246 [Vulgatibacter incomptus]|uniref:Uncharacterized protein n=1 Tax=Vulgatibacter incomptus TaxID=1391653 RepID=A0A0K1P9R9_9BACT|nr:hypothetical protein AKJ08_0246 [Vulgatibacter incomptus]
MLFEHRGPPPRKPAAQPTSADVSLQSHEYVSIYMRSSAAVSFYVQSRGARLPRVHVSTSRAGRSPLVWPSLDPRGASSRPKLRVQRPIAGGSPNGGSMSGFEMRANG